MLHGLRRRVEAWFSRFEPKQYAGPGPVEVGAEPVVHAGRYPFARAATKHPDEWDMKADTQDLTVAEAMQLAVDSHQTGDLKGAENMCRQILNALPQHGDALHLLGVIAHQQGEHQRAVELISRAASIDGKNPHYFNNLGVSLSALGRFEAAADSFRTALKLMPDSWEACFGLGEALRAQQKFDDAIESFERTVRLKPDHIEAHHNLGLTLLKSGAYDDAIFVFKAAIALNPELDALHNDLGLALHARGSYEEAISSFRRAVALSPGLYQALHNLALSLKELGKLDEAIATLQQAMHVKPDFPEAYFSYGNVLHQQGQVPEAVASYRHALQLKPDFARAHSNLVYALNFLPDYTPETIFSEHLEWARRHAAPLKPAIRPHRNLRTQDRRLRVGYVSGNFRRHAVSYFFEPVLVNHDRDRLSIFCYSDVGQPDAYTERMRNCRCVWRDIAGQSDEAVARLIAGDEIDILVDLSGHTDGHRLLMFARKPAPIQVTWNGYANTTGMDVMDYRITDALADPPGMTEHLHTEQLVRLPEIYMAYQPPETSPPVGPPPSLANGYVTFGSFNAVSKITPQVIAVWAQILKALPAARLLILTVPEGGTGVRMEQAFAGHGVGAERLELSGRLPFQQFLAAHQRVDVALDPFPFNGTTTTCQTLWMGVPLITLAGRSHVARVGVSMLSNLGLERLIARDEREYVSLAVALAQDDEELATLRAGLRARMLASPNTDGARLTRFLEAAYAKMWKDYCVGSIE